MGKTNWKEKYEEADRKLRESEQEKLTLKAKIQTILLILGKGE